MQTRRVVYNGHKRVHGLKFQSVALPNGLIGNLYEPVEGRRHHAQMLEDSGLLNDLSRVGFNKVKFFACIRIPSSQFNETLLPGGCPCSHP